MNEPTTTPLEIRHLPPGQPLAHLLGGHLVAAGLVSPADMEAALFEQRHHPGVRLGEVLLRMRLIEPRDLLRALEELAVSRRLSA